MRRTIAGLVATGLLTVGLAAPAAAQARGYVGFGGGLSLPTGDAGEGLKMGWVGQVIAGITGPSGKFGGRIDGMYVRHSFDGTVDGSTALFGANGDLVFSPGSQTGKIRPYLLGGVGFFNVKSEVGTVESEGVTKFAWNAGAGLRFGGGGKASFFIESRYISVSTDPESFGFIPISVGVRFGGN